jgi:hypothetical protein
VKLASNDFGLQENGENIDFEDSELDSQDDDYQSGDNYDMI